MQNQEQSEATKGSRHKSGNNPALDQYMSVNLTVQGTSAGPAVNVYLKSQNGPLAVWSMGEGDDSSNGLLIEMNTSGALPLSSINITQGDATFQTIAGSGGGNSWSFQCNLYVAGEQGLAGFTLSSVADSSVTVTASINNSKPYTLGQAATTFPWKPLS